MKKLKQTVLVLVGLVGLASFLLPAVSVSAETYTKETCGPAGGTWQDANYSTNNGVAQCVFPAGSSSADAAQYTTKDACETAHYQWSDVTNSCIPLSQSRTTVTCDPATEEALSTNDRVCCPKGTGSSPTSCMFAKYINPVIQVLSVLAGIAVVIGIVVGGIQYGASAGDPQKAAKARGMITKALMGLVAFMFLYSAFQFLSPGNISKNFEPTGTGGSIASQCSSTFLGLKPWFAYLPDSSFESGTCNITNFSLLGSNGKDSQLVPVLLAITDDLVRVAGMVAVAFVITGGIKYVTSSGEPDKTKQALETIISALVGVAIAIIAAAVVSYIGTQLSK